MRERERELHPPLGVGTLRDPTSLGALAQNLENDENSRRPNASIIWNNRDVMIIHGIGISGGNDLRGHCQLSVAKPNW